MSDYYGLILLVPIGTDKGEKNGILRPTRLLRNKRRVHLLKVRTRARGRSKPLKQVRRRRFHRLREVRTPRRSVARWNYVQLRNSLPLLKM